MALAETARLIASLELDAKKFNAGVDKALGKMGRLQTRSVAVGTAIGTGVSRLAEAGVRKLVGQVTGGLDSLAQLETATTSVDAAIKQMGLTGQVTASQVAGWANEIEASIGAAFDDKDITAAATTLIRFGKTTPDNLRPALQVMTDLATKTGSVDSAASLLAKALADPTKAAGKLARTGVVLTKAEQDQIKAMVKAGDVAGAQKVILDSLAKSTKGAAEASQGPYQKSLSILRDVTEDAQRALATGLLPVIMEVRDELATQLAKPETLARIKRFGEDLAGGFRDLVGFVKSIPWDQVGSVLKGAADFGSNLAHAFTSLPTEAKGLILGLAALNKLSGGAVINVGVDLLKGAAGTLFQQFLGKGSPANPMFVVPVGGGLGGLGGVGAAAGGGLLSSAFKLILPVGIGLAIGEALGPYVSPILRDLTNQHTFEKGGSLKGITPSVKTGLSPDERQAFNDQKRALEKVRTSAEANRIALVSATRTGDNSIVSAIRANRPIVNVNVRATTTTTRVTYTTGTTLSRYAGKIVPLG